MVKKPAEYLWLVFLPFLVTFTSGVTAILMVGTPIFLGHNSPISAPLSKTDKPQDHQRKHNNSHRKEYQKPMSNPLLCTKSNYGCIRYHNATGAISGWLQFEMVEISIELLRNGSGCELKQGGQKHSWIRWLKRSKVQ